MPALDQDRPVVRLPRLQSVVETRPMAIILAVAASRDTESQGASVVGVMRCDRLYLESPAAPSLAPSRRRTEAVRGAAALARMP